MLTRSRPSSSAAAAAAAAAIPEHSPSCRRPSQLGALCAARVHLVKVKFGVAQRLPRRDSAPLSALSPPTCLNWQLKQPAACWDSHCAVKEIKQKQQERQRKLKLPQLIQHKSCYPRVGKGLCGPSSLSCHSCPARLPPCLPLPLPRTTTTHLNYDNYLCTCSLHSLRPGQDPILSRGLC